MLAIVTDAFGGRGGIAQYNRDFLTALAETGAVSSITVVPRQAPDEAVLPVGIEQTRARLGRSSYSVAAIRMALLRQVDVVFCGHLFMAPLARVIKHLKRAKLIVQTHGTEVWPQPSKAQRAAVEAADLVLCVSRRTRAAVLSWAAIAPERALVLPDTVGDAFTPGDGATRRAELLGLAGKRVLLTVGRLDSRERYKGQDRVIAVIPELIAKGYDTHYVVIGDGDDCERLKALADHFWVSERVHFLGSVGIETLIDMYRIADLFVMPSTGEGFGVAFLEAMACGTPVLGLGVAGDRDALADGELGTVAREAELVPTIERLLDRRKETCRLSAAVRNRFGRERFIENVRLTLDHLMESA